MWLWQRVWDFVWKARQRDIDAKILWPSIREQATDPEQARSAMLAHMRVDPAYSNMDIKQRIEYVHQLPL